MERVQSHAGAMAQVLDELAMSWEHGEVVILNEAFSWLTLRILTRSLFDVDVESTDRRRDCGIRPRLQQTAHRRERLDAVAFRSPDADQSTN